MYKKFLEIKRPTAQEKWGKYMNNSQKRVANSPLFNSLTFSIALFFFFLSGNGRNSENSKQTQHTLGSTFFPKIKTELGRMILQKGKKKGQFLYSRDS